MDSTDGFRESLKWYPDLFILAAASIGLIIVIGTLFGTQAVYYASYGWTLACGALIILGVAVLLRTLRYGNFPVAFVLSFVIAGGVIGYGHLEFYRWSVARETEFYVKQLKSGKIEQAVAPPTGYLHFLAGRISEGVEIKDPSGEEPLPQQVSGAWLLWTWLVQIGLILLCGMISSIVPVVWVFQQSENELKDRLNRIARQRAIRKKRKELIERRKKKAKRHKRGSKPRNQDSIPVGQNYIQ